MNFCTKCRAKMTLQCNKCGFKSPQGSEFCGSCGEDTEFRVEKRARNAALAAEAAATAAAARVREAEARTGIRPIERYYDNGQLQARRGQKEGKKHGPHSAYARDGEMYEKGTYNMGMKCGEWIQSGFFGGQKTVTYPPWPPGLEDDS